jgi:hypothetical protein
MDFAATHHRLPDNLGYVSSLPSLPCGCCHSTVFDVVLNSRQSRLEDGLIREWKTVDVECPNCKLLTHRSIVSRRVIGSLNTRTGELLLA